MIPRKRLDVLLVERGLFATRAKAQAALMAGKVEVEGRPNPKPGDPAREDLKVRVLEDAVPFVSRGGLKLQAALDEFKIKPEGRTALDVGASTGGFTDCLLQRKAAKVYAVDVGHGQLDVSLRTDPRVVNLERTHAGRMEPGLFGPPQERPDLAVADVSFISLTKVLPAIIACLKQPFEIAALIKPQFELEPKKVPKGVVKKEEFRQEAVNKVSAFAKERGLIERGLIESPIHGPKGNVEFLIFWTSV
ncbi:MAG: TlyA family RNA methyltransferase [Elusimicrobiota bacterium]|jgi:23S rRNA (cytidine1920-2'-O)/16S rRNA (cytidine1409-2'-O)-methyltransferase